MENFRKTVTETSSNYGITRKRVQDSEITTPTDESAYQTDPELLQDIYCPGGLKAVPLRLSGESSCDRSVYIIEDNSENPQYNFTVGYRMKLLNIPPYVTSNNLTQFFEKFGPIKLVTFEPYTKNKALDALNRKDLTEFSNSEEPFNFKTAYIVFSLASSLQEALKIKSIDLFQSSSKESTVISGMSLWYDKYLSRRLDGEKTLVCVRKCLQKYERERAEKERLRKAKEAAADEDGWCTVGPNGGFTRNQDHIDKVHKRMKSKPAECKDFYRHQLREGNKKRLEELRQKFVCDVRRIHAIKNARKFRP